MMTDGGLGARTLKHLGFARAWFFRLISMLRPESYVPYTECYHCWESFPQSEMMIMDYPLDRPIEWRNEHNETYSYMESDAAYRIPLCPRCWEEDPILYGLVVYPWGLEYYWQSLSSGDLYRKRPKPAKLGITEAELPEKDDI